MSTWILSRRAFWDKNAQMDHGKRRTCFEFFIEGTFSNVSSTNHDWDSVLPRPVDCEGNTSLVGLVLSFTAVLDVRRYFGVTVSDLHQDAVSVWDGIWTTISLEKLWNKKKNPKINLVLFCEQECLSALCRASFVDVYLAYLRSYGHLKIVKCIGMYLKITF